MKRSSQRSERGGILILAAIVVPTVLLFVGLGVDSFILFVKKIQQQSTAEQGALASLSTFINQGSTSEAIRAAERIGELTRYVMDSSQPVRIGELTSGYAGNVEFGTWDGVQFAPTSDLALVTAVRLTLRDTPRTQNKTNFGALIGFLNFDARRSSAIAFFESGDFEKGRNPYTIVHSD
jgi:Flp pilus assembly protein TadG